MKVIIRKFFDEELGCPVVSLIVTPAPEQLQVNSIMSPNALRNLTEEEHFTLTVEVLTKQLAAEYRRKLTAAVAAAQNPHSGITSWSN